MKNALTLFSYFFLMSSMPMHKLHAQVNSEQCQSSKGQTPIATSADFRLDETVVRYNARNTLPLIGRLYNKNITNNVSIDTVNGVVMIVIPTKYLKYEEAAIEIESSFDLVNKIQGPIYVTNISNLYGMTKVSCEKVDTKNEHPYRTTVLELKKLKVFGSRGNLGAAFTMLGQEYNVEFSNN